MLDHLFARMAPLPKREHFRCWRNSSQDMSGEYNPLDSWTAELALRRNQQGHPVVVLKLSVWGARDRKRWKLRATRWSASIHMGSFYETLGNGKCKSLADAMRQARRLPRRKVLRKLKERAFDPQNATCVYLMKPDGTIRPFCTLLPWRSGYDDAYRQWGSGEGRFLLVTPVRRYFNARNSHDVYPRFELREHENSGTGYTNGPLMWDDTARRYAIANTIEPWIDWYAKEEP